MRRCLLLPAVWLALACSPEPTPPNLLLVTIDTLRADHTSLHGYARDTTPNLRRLASDGVQFDSAYAPSGTTGPTHASIFTGSFPVAHGVVKNGQVLEEAHTTLAEVARASGYRTAAFVSSYVLDAKFGFAQGFDTYDDDFAADESTLRLESWADEPFEDAFDRRADRTTEAALEWLAKEGTRDEGPFLLFLHYFDPHDPYVPPPGFDERFGEASGSALEDEVRRYDGEIAFADAALGRLLDGLAAHGLDRKTVVAVTADHGEGLMDHGVMRHGVHIYEAFVRVPLVLRLPSRRSAGARVATPVSLVDLLPTLVELGGLRADSRLWQGRSLARGIRGDEELAEAPIFLQRRHYEPGEIEGVRVAGEKFGIRTSRWKYLEAPDEGTRELYDLVADPGETRNQEPTRPAVAAGLREQLAAWRDEPARRPTAPVSEEDRRRLEALGYVE